MAKFINISFLGDKGLQRALNRIEHKVAKRIVRKALRAETKLAIMEVAKRTPVDEGNLKWAILNSKPRPSRGKFKGDFGTAFVWPTREEVGISPDDKGYYPMHLEFGYTHAGGTAVAARPYVRPAFEETKQAAFDRVRNAIGAAVAAEWRKP